MSKRFVDDGFEAIEDQSFTDTLTDKTYYVDYFDEIIELCNNLADENEQLKAQLKELQAKNDDIEWLRNNTVWEQMPSNRRTFTKTKYER